MPSAGDELELARKRRDERRRVGRRQHLGRMRIEGQHDRLAGEPGGEAARLLEDVRMSAVHSVEIADRHHGIAEATGSEVWPRNVSMYVGAAP